MASLIWTVASWFGALVDWLKCWFNGDWIFCNLFKLFFDLVTGGVAVVAGALAWVPIPAALDTFEWPDAGPLAGVLFEVGFGQATAILAASFTLKFILRLIPLVRL